MKILNNKGTWIMVVIFLATLGLMIYDPLGIKTETGLAAIWYMLPAVIAWALIFVKPTLSRSSVMDESDVRSEAIKSVLRHVITSLTAIISLKAAFGIEIPYIDGIFELVKWLFGQTDQVVNAIMTLVSFGTIVYGFVKSGFRFEQIAATKANSKGRKYYQ